jgi:hypothetical protein
MKGLDLPPGREQAAKHSQMNGEASFRPDQRAFLLHFTGLMVGPVSLTTTPFTKSNQNLNYLNQ